MRAKNKKDTIFAKSFIVLDHREKYRGGNVGSGRLGRRWR